MTPRLLLHEAHFALSAHATDGAGPYRWQAGQDKASRQPGVLHRRRGRGPNHRRPGAPAPHCFPESCGALVFSLYLALKQYTLFLPLHLPLCPLHISSVTLALIALTAFSTLALISFTVLNPNTPPPPDPIPPQSLSNCVSS